MNNEQVVGLIVASAGVREATTVSHLTTRAMREAERRRKDRREWTREWTAVVWVKSPCDFPTENRRRALVLLYGLSRVGKKGTRDKVL